MSSIPGLLVQVPVPLVPGVSQLPEPWLSATPEQRRQYALTLAAFGNFEQLQQTENMEAVEAGNLDALHAIGIYNGLVKKYWLNGGASNRWGWKLPSALPVLDGCYKPAVDAAEEYDPVTRTWKPNGQVLETPIWSLVPGTVLYQVQP